MTSVSPMEVKSSDKQLYISTSAGPSQEIMSDEPRGNSLPASLCCPDCSSIICGILVPSSYCCGYTVVNERQELILLRFGKYWGTIREPGAYCISACGFRLTPVSTSILTAKIASERVVDSNGSPISIRAV